jgi:hypothetical protein
MKVSCKEEVRKIVIIEIDKANAEILLDILSWNVSIPEMIANNKPHQEKVSDFMENLAININNALNKD